MTIDTDKLQQGSIVQIEAELLHSQFNAKEKIVSRHDLLMTNLE